MICKLINKTPEPQQINFYDGSAVMVAPSDSVEIEKGKVYQGEIERLKRFFIIEEYQTYIPEESKKRVKKVQDITDIPEDITIITEGEE